MVRTAKEFFVTTIHGYALSLGLLIASSLQFAMGHRLFATILVAIAIGIGLLSAMSSGFRSRLSTVVSATTRLIFGVIALVTMAIAWYAFLTPVGIIRRVTKKTTSDTEKRSGWRSIQYTEDYDAPFRQH